MRKADYAALAEIIRAKLADYKAKAACVERKPEALQAMQCARDIAHQFADRASVNRAEFLKACGIEP